MFNAVFLQYDLGGERQVLLTQRLVTTVHQEIFIVMTSSRRSLPVRVPAALPAINFT